MYGIPQEVVDQLNTQFVNIIDDELRRRLIVYRLRILGYSPHVIADALNTSLSAVADDTRWCVNNLAPTYGSVHEFRQISIAQLEEIYQLLITPRVILETLPSGETIRSIVPPTTNDIRTALAIKAEQAKFTGAHVHPVDQGDHDVTYVLNVAQPIGAQPISASDPRSIDVTGAEQPAVAATPHTTISDLP